MEFIHKEGTLVRQKAPNSFNLNMLEMPLFQILCKKKAGYKYKAGHTVSQKKMPHGQYIPKLLFSLLI